MSEKLTDELRDVVIAKAAANISLSTICAWLKSTHGVDVNKSTLSRVVKSHRTDLANVSKGIARASIVPTLEAGMQALQARLGRAQAIEEKCADAVLNVSKEDGGGTFYGVPTWAKANAEVCRIEDLMHKAAGLNQADDPMLDGLVGLMGLALDEEEKAAQAALDAADAADESEA